MKNINDVIQEALKEVNFEEIAKDAAVAKIKLAVKECVDNQFRYHSDFMKKLEEHIKQEIGFDVTKIRLPEYRTFIISQVNDALARMTSEDHAKEIINHINTKVVGEHRDEIEFGKFYEELCEAINDSCEENDNEKYFIEVNDKESYAGSYLSSKYHQLTISEKKDTYASRGTDGKSEIMYFAFSDGVIYHSRHSDEMELSNVYTWLMALKYRKTKILNLRNESSTIPDKY